MSNIENKNKGSIEEWFKHKNNNVVSNQEIQTFKSNVLSIKNQFGLQNANINTILEACYQATLFNLPLNKNFGYCWVVPFKSQAQFQIGYKGYIQLAMRTHEYKIISTSDVRVGEIKNNDRLKGIEFEWIQDEQLRLDTPIIGYVAFFEMKNGYQKSLYMSLEQVQNHFNNYSETYKKNKKFIVSDFDSMALKTVLTQLIRKWGILSVEMQNAYESDQAVITENKKIYIDNPKTVTDQASPITQEEVLNQEEKEIESFKV